MVFVNMCFYLVGSKAAPEKASRMLLDPGKDHSGRYAPEKGIRDYAAVRQTGLAHINLSQAAKDLLQ